MVMLNYYFLDNITPDSGKREGNFLHYVVLLGFWIAEMVN